MRSTLSRDVAISLFLPQPGKKAAQRLNSQAC